MTHEHELDSLFNPRSVAVIGASESPAKWGYVLCRILIEDGFKGDVYPINPKGGEILGLKFYPKLESVPNSVDLALIMVPKDRVLPSIHDCVKKGVKTAIIHTAGFREIGKEGSELEREILDVARKGGLRIVGPNSMNVFSSSSKLNLTGIEKFPSGSIAFISQSGNLGYTLALESQMKKVGFSKFISVGNQADIGMFEYLEYMGQDPETKAIILYIEGLKPKEGTAFLEAARKITPYKPIVVLKGGSTSAGSRSTASHTGSMAGSNEVNKAAFQQAGIIHVENSDELLSIAEALTKCPIPNGKNFAVLGGGGGHATLMCDAAEKYKLNIPAFRAEIQKSLAGLLPDRASAKNPVDFTGAGESDLSVYSKCTGIALNESDISGALIYGLFGGYRTDLEEGDNTYYHEALRIVEVKNKYQKPIILHSIYANGNYPSIEVLREQGIPVYESIEVAAKCMEALYRYGAFQRQSKLEGEIVNSSSKLPSTVSIESFVKKAKERHTSHLLESEGMDLLQVCEIPTPKRKIALTEDEAVRYAEEVGYPVVLKILSPQVIHKSDVNGVKINLTSEEQVRQAFKDIVNGTAIKVKDAEILGVLVYPHLSNGTEVILGVFRDKQFGPVLMFGLGGIFVELFKDVSFRVLPISELDAQEMIQETKAAQLLNGMRGMTPKDTRNLIDIMLKLSNLVMTNPEIDQIDLNPVLIFENNSVVVDARFILETKMNEVVKQ